ncbi:MAG: hypothetical protein Q9M92_09145 [Enterobacterales bacterium]|nr:hypothetical protein [Enterobacterales bacterium]
MDNRLKIIIAVVTSLAVILGGLFYYKSSAEKSFQANAPDWLEYDRVSFNPFTGNFDLKEVEIPLLNQLFSEDKIPVIESLVTNFSMDGNSTYIALEGIEIGQGKLGSQFFSDEYLRFLEDDTLSSTMIINIDRDKSDNSADISFELDADRLWHFSSNFSILRINSFMRELNKLQDIDLELLTQSRNYNAYSRSASPIVILLDTLKNKMQKIKVVEADFGIEDRGYYYHYSSYNQKVYQSIVPTEIDYLAACLDRNFGEMFNRMICFLKDGSIDSAQFSLSPSKPIKYKVFIQAMVKGMSKKQVKKFNIEGDI